MEPQRKNSSSTNVEAGVVLFEAARREGADKKRKGNGSDLQEHHFQLSEVIKRRLQDYFTTFVVVAIRPSTRTESK